MIQAGNRWAAALSHRRPQPVVWRRSHGRREGLPTPQASSYLDDMDPADRQTTLATATGSRDPELGLRAVAALRGLVEVLEALQVDNARAKGWSWQDIAAALEVSRQAVHKKHAGRPVVRPSQEA